MDNGALGEIYAGRTRWLRRDGMPGFGGWFGQKELSGGGPLIDLGVHRIDLALWLMGYPKPSYVLAKTHNHLARRKAKQAGAKVDVEDYASAALTFENGAILQVEASWASHIKDKEDMETVLLGTEGGLTQSNLNGRYEFSSSLYREEHGCKMDIELQGGVDAPPSAMYHFIDAILLDKPHIAGADEGLYVMRLLDAIYRSSSEGKPVAL